MSSSPARRRFYWAYQIVAVCLLLLTTSPFTAPFATCDLAHSVLHTGLDETCDSVKDKVADDTAIAVFVDAHAFVPEEPAEPLPDSARADAVGTGAALFPLRL